MILELFIQLAQSFFVSQGHHLKLINKIPLSTKKDLA